MAKTIFVSGATDGIGCQTARELAEMGHRILLHGRDEKKVETVMGEIRQESGSKAIVPYLADFADLESTAKMAEKIKNEQERLDVLVNNAGTFSRNRTLSANGHELTFQVNHLAHFLLTLRLLDLIKKSAPARIVNVASGAHRSASESYFDDIQAEESYSGYSAYSFSKLANILFTNELAERMAESGVTVNSLHPGVIDTKLLHMGFGGGGRSLEEGAKTSVYLAVSDEVQDVSGKYFSEMREKPASNLARDRDLGKKLWKISEDLVKGYLD